MGTDVRVVFLGRCGEKERIPQEIALISQSCSWDAGYPKESEGKVEEEGAK